MNGGTEGSALFVGAGGILSQDNANFFWDNSSKRLGVGTNAPARTLDVWSTGSANFGLVSTVDSGTKYGFGESFYVLRNASATPTNKSILAMGGEGTYNDAASLSNYGWYIYDVAASKYLIFAEGSTAFFGLGTETPGAALHVDSNAANTVPIARLQNTAGDIDLFRTDATPEAAVTGSIGDIAVDSTTGRAYLKQSGSATNTGWRSLSGYTLQFSASAFNPADADSYYIGNVPTQAASQTAVYRQLSVPRAGTVTRIEVKINVVGTVGSTETSSIFFRLNNTTDTLISDAVLADNSTAAFTFRVANSALAIAVAQGDLFEIKWTTPTWATNPTTVLVSGVVFIE